MGGEAGIRRQASNPCRDNCWGGDVALVNALRRAHCCCAPSTVVDLTGMLTPYGLDGHDVRLDDRAHRLRPVAAGDIRRLLLDALEAALDDTARRTASCIQRELPEYRMFASEADEAEWRSSLRRSLALFVEVQRRTTPTLDAADVSFIEGIGARRAEQGVHLTVVLNSVRVAVHEGLCAARRVVQQSAADDALEAMEWLSLRMTQFANAFSDAVGRGYFRRSDGLASERERERVRFVVDLLTGRIASYEAARAEAARLGLVLHHRCGVVLVPSSPRCTALFGVQVRSRLPDAVLVTMASAPTPHVVLLVPVEADADWHRGSKAVEAAAEHCRVVAFTAGVCDVPVQLHERYVETSPLLAAAGATSGDGWLVPVEQLLHGYVVANAPLPVAAAVDRRVLHPLKAHRRARTLLDALDAFFRAGGSPKAASRLMGVSDTTARAYRESIEEATGLYFDQPADVLWLGFGWLQHRLHAQQAT